MTGKEITLQCGVEMRPIRGHGRLSHTGDAPEANKPYVPGPIESGSIDTKYHRLLHRCCVSLDLETAFKWINISQEVKPEICPDCKTEKCRCPAFMPEMPCSSVLSMPTNIDIDEEEEISDLVENTTLRTLYPLVQSPSDEEADQEVAAICSTPVYFRVKSRRMHRHQYYMYNSIDLIEANNRQKRIRQDSSHTQGYPVEH